MGRRLSTAIALCSVLAATGCDPAAPAPGPATTPPAGSPPATTGVTPAPPSGTPSRHAGGATLIAFVTLGLARSSAAAVEVTGPEQLDAFLVGPPAADQTVRDAVRRNRGNGLRLFAFLLLGCQNDGASLMVQQSRMYAVLTGEPKECFAAEEFLAVFAVPAGQVPEGVRLG